jgi:hypothetical protein
VMRVGAAVNGDRRESVGALLLARHVRFLSLDDVRR